MVSIDLRVVEDSSRSIDPVNFEAFDLRVVTGYQAGVAILDLQFVPEPSALLMLPGGILVLAGLFTYSRRAG